jgi:hypothetical protein
MRQGRRLRTGILSSIGAVAVLVLGQGVASAADGSEQIQGGGSGILSASLDDPIGTITDTLDDPIGTITDTLDGATDTITDAVDHPIGTVTDTLDGATGTIGGVVDDAVGGAVGGAVDGTIDPIVGGSGASSSGGSGAVDGSGDGRVTSTVDPETTSSPATSSAPRAHEMSSGPRAAAKAPSDLDELAEGGNDVVEGRGDAVCVGSARVVCLDLVGGLGVVGILFRAAEGAREVVSAFVDALASTGIDLLGASVTLVALTLIGLVSISRRPSSRAARSRRSLAGA